MQERAYWVAWSQVPGIGATLLLRLHHCFGSLAAAWEADQRDLQQVDGISAQGAEALVAARSHLHPEAILTQHERDNPSFWTPADPDYPRLLLEIPDPPPILYYRGRVERAENRGEVPAIAIVGTREPSAYGERWTERLARALANAGFVVVSGLADGIDAIAHQACLWAGGRTIAVMGTGVNIAYPSSNRRLASRIAQDGLILSEFPAGTKPDRMNFPRRNRIIAGLTRATLVLEAPLKSGALITARVANEYGRDVYALPASLDNERGEGCLHLINSGAQIILGESQLLEMLGAIPDLPFSPPSGQSEPKSRKGHDPAPLPQQTVLPLLPDPSLDPELAAILLAIPANPVALDAIVAQTQLPTGAVLSGLVQLELLGRVSQLPGMMYQRS
ncbi:MAG: DNA-processing protein DprA [Synechococcales bacterium]|nr:DNA-processing protein DprA [Synechococcales bacterium]